MSLYFAPGPEEHREKCVSVQWKDVSVLRLFFFASTFSRILDIKGRLDISPLPLCREFSCRHFSAFVQCQELCVNYNIVVLQYFCITQTKPLLKRLMSLNDICSTFLLYVSRPDRTEELIYCCVGKVKSVSAIMVRYGTKVFCIWWKSFNADGNFQSSYPL